MKAFNEDSQVLVEEFISGREFTIGVFKSKGIEAKIVEIGSQEIDDKLLLFIKDNGIGIPTESGKKLFNLFTIHFFR